MYSYKFEPKLLKYIFTWIAITRFHLKQIICKKNLNHKQDGIATQMILNSID